VVLRWKADGGFLCFLRVDTWDHHNMCGCHPHLPLGNLTSGFGNSTAFLHPPEDCVSTFIIPDAIHIRGERTKATQDVSPCKDTLPQYCTAIVQCTKLLKRMAKCSLENRTQLYALKYI